MKKYDDFPLSIRVSREDLDRLEKLAAILPMPRTAIARDALRRGLAILEEAAPKFVGAEATKRKGKP